MTSSAKNKDKTKKDARDIRAEALKIANSQHIEGQTREQTRLIAAGIQRGMEQFLRQQSEKARELDKRVKKARRLTAAPQQTEQTVEVAAPKGNPLLQSWLPWGMLIASWFFFAVYLWVSRQ